MSKLAALLVFGSVLTSAVSVSADHHHKDFWKFLKGEWTYEIPELELKGTATWRLAAKGNVLMSRFEDETGLIGIETCGWRRDTKKMVAVGYGSKGNYWHIEFEKITPDTIEGPTYGVLPDGRSYEGKFVGKKVNEDRYEWEFVGKTGEGEELKTSGKYDRKK